MNLRPLFNFVVSTLLVSLQQKCGKIIRSLLSFAQKNKIVFIRVHQRAILGVYATLEDPIICYLCFFLTQIDISS